MLTTLPPSGRLPRKWTVVEDQKLREEVAAQMTEGEVKDWCRIAEKLPGRTNKDCRKRWHNSVAGGLKKGQWSRSEDQQLARGVQRFGQRWTLVANTVQSRSADQCAKRWQQSLDPDLDRSEWRENEDKVLMEAVKKLGRHWKDIQRQNFPGRSKNSIKNRYTVLLRRYQNQGIALPFGAVTPEPTTPDLRHSTYSATDDDEDFGDVFLPTQTQVSTPEPQQPWTFDDDSFANWSSGNALSIPPEPPHFPSSQPQQQLPHINTSVESSMSIGAQWSWPTDFPQITYQEPLPTESDFETSPNSLSSMNLSPYSPEQCILGPTTPILMGATGRRSFPGTPSGPPPRSSPRPLSVMASPYGDADAMNRMIWDSRFGMERQTAFPYQ